MSSKKPVSSKKSAAPVARGDGVLSGKVVLITGGARRVGACIARTLHVAGANVVIHYRESAADAKALAQRVAAQCAPAQILRADLLGRESRRQWQHTRRRIGEQAARQTQKGRNIGRGHLQHLGEALGQLTRGTALVGLDLLNRGERAADLPRQLLLCQVARAAICPKQPSEGK